jgi:hypothetical protein
LDKPVQSEDFDLVKRLVDRLEHLSVDSTYAHRASGVRGSLLGIVERLEEGGTFSREDQQRMEQLVEYGFEILEQAAREVGASR